MTSILRSARPFLRSAFIAALIVTFIVALLPQAPTHGGNKDKALHFCVFYALTLLGAACFPGQRALTRLAIFLVSYGGVIEIVQGIMPFGRSPDMLDLAADCLGILAVLTPLMLGGWRRDLATRPQ